MTITRLLLGILACGVAATSFSACAEATTYIATYTGTVGKAYDGLDDIFGGTVDVMDTVGTFGGGDLTGAAYTAVFSADFNASSTVTYTGNAIAVDGFAPVTGTLTINGHSQVFTSDFVGLLGIAFEDPFYGNGVSSEAVTDPLFGLDVEIENFDPLRPVVGADYTTPVTYTVDPSDILYGLFAIHDATFTNLEFGYLIPQTVSVSSVPEPASWALMIAGFGAVGLALRRRRFDARAAA